tara:strand:+ start:110 stop:394 length:285 start_codon:yes stop_codon:yes gene_type:complete
MNTIQWLEIIDLAEELKCSVKSVYNYREEGTFLPGIHFYTVGNGKIRGKHIYNLQKCRKALVDKTKEKNLNRLESYDHKEILKVRNRKLNYKSQ